MSDSFYYFLQASFTIAVFVMVAISLIEGCARVEGASRVILGFFGVCAVLICIALVFCAPIHLVIHTFLFEREYVVPISVLPGLQVGVTIVGIVLGAIAWTGLGMYLEFTRW